MPKLGSKSIRETGAFEFLDMVQVTVALPSGQDKTFSLEPSSKVGDLRILTQKLFKRGFLRLVAADHSVVDPAVSLQAAGLEDGDHLTAIAVEARLAKTEFLRCFALEVTGLSLGDLQVLVVTALTCKISSRVSRRFRDPMP